MLKIIVSEKSERVLIITRHPYPLSTFAALTVKRIAGRQDRKIIVIADITDLWPESLTFMSENLFSKMLQLIGICLNRVVYKRCDYIIVHNCYYKEYVWKIYLEGQIERDRIFVIPHLVDTREFTPLTKREAINNLRKYLDHHLIQEIFTKVVVGYSGLISNTIGSDVLAKIFQLFKNDNRLIFLIVGEGPLKQKLVNYVKQNNIKNVWFIGPFPHRLMKYVINLFDIAIITSYHEKLIAPSIYWFPKKLVEYSACGKPILFIGISKFIKDALHKYNAGVSIHPLEIHKMVQYLNHIISNYTYLSRNSRRLAEQNFGLQIIATKLQRLMGFWTILESEK